MKRLTGLSLLLIFQGTNWAEPPRLKDEALRAFSYHDKPPDQPADHVEPPAPESGNDVVEMETFNVSESVVRQDLGKAIRDHAAAQAEKEFSWTKGGLIAEKKLGGVNLDLGFWPQLNSFPTGMGAKQSTAIRVEVLHLKW